MVVVADAERGAVEVVDDAADDEEGDEDPADPARVA
jgi:hypothetical protein